MADICVRSSAPIIPMAKTKAGRMIFVTLVLQKGIWGLPNFVGEIRSRGWKCSLKFQVFMAQFPFSMLTEVLHSSVQIHAVVCILLFFLPVLQLSFRTFPSPFYTASLWILSQHLSPVPAIPPDFMDRRAERRVQVQGKWVVEPRAHWDVFDSLNHALSTGPSCLSHNPPTYFWSQ